MIVWVASFPRSGNTFLRILLDRLYGVRTSVVYDVDYVAKRLGPGFVGYTERPAEIAAMRASEEVHFVKTHRQRDADVDEQDRAICLVRDGRDSLVSWARMNSEDPGCDYESELRRMIERRDPVGTGGWGANVLGWLRPAVPHRVVLRYEDLAREPEASVDRVMGVVAPDVPRVAGAAPTFEELRRVDGRFFRKGRTGTHREELPGELHELFWSRPDNAEAMGLLGHTR